MGCLQHDGAVTELLNQAIFPLNGFEASACNLSFSSKAFRERTRVGDFSDLVALEAIPALVASGIDELITS
jgi:hypothetical protein